MALMLFECLLSKYWLIKAIIVLFVEYLCLVNFAQKRMKLK